MMKSEKEQATVKSTIMKAGALILFKIKYVEELLGPCPCEPQVYEDFIASKIAKRKDLTDEQKEKLKAEEIKRAYEDIEATEQRGWTVFLKQDDKPYTLNHWVKGFLKTAFETLQETGDMAKVPVYKSRIDRFIHVHPRRLFFKMNGGKMNINERPLRAMTPHGPRVTLVRSESLPPGTELSYVVELLRTPNISPEHIILAHDYGKYSGHGQWRSAEHGRFEVTHTELLKELPVWARRNQPSMKA